MSDSGQRSKGLRDEYTQRYDTALVPVAANLSQYISDLMKGQPRIDRITVRAKGIDSFVNKAETKREDGKLKYTEPLHQIQDQIGARIVVFYKSDVDTVYACVKKYFNAIEMKKLVPESESQFGYFGQHLVLVLPNDVIDHGLDKTLLPEFFELQIKTLFQHAWAEANHDLAYKPGEKPLTADQERLVAFTSAQGWGADHIFDQLFKERNA